MIDRAGLAPAGTEGYPHLVEGAVRFEVFGVDLLVAGLQDIEHIALEGEGHGH